MLNPFDWSGTASRKQYWTIFIVWFLASIGTGYLLLSGVQATHLFKYSLIAVAVLQSVFLTAIVRRLHDIGRTGLWAVLVAVPYLGLPFILVIGFLKSRIEQSTLWPSRKRHRVGQFAALIFVGLAVSRLFWAPYWIPSGSMKPTLLVGDYLASPIGADNTTPKRGEVFVLQHPANGTAYVGRLIGLAGDTVQMVDGAVVLNGTPLVQKRVEDFTEINGFQGPRQSLPRCANGAVGVGAICIKGQFVETLPDETSYRILDIQGSQLDNTGRYTVPDGHLFFLGDNRDNSNDSRVPANMRGLGFVPVESLIGQPKVIVFSFSGQSWWQFWNWRSDRSFKPVQ